VVLKACSILMLALLAACHRVPDWEVRDDRSQSSALMKQWAQYHRWLWTCRANVGRTDESDGILPTGIAITNFLTEYRRAGLTVVDSLGSKRILGTAVLWGDEGLLVTLNHWLSSATELECRNAENDWQPATLQQRDPDLNLAVLRISSQAGRKSGRFGEWPKAPRPQLDDQLTVLAAPYPGMVERQPVNLVWLKGSLQTGIDEHLHLFSPSVAPHFAGGVLVNARGEWLGFLNSQHSGLWGQAISASFLSEAISELLSKGEVRRLYLGILVRWVPNQGFVVQELEVDGVAYSAGLRLGDVIVRWNGKKLTEASDWPSLKLSDLGSTVDIDLLRSDRAVQIKMTVRELSRR
jgi:S1-C subfamily serine protease